MARKTNKSKKKGFERPDITAPVIKRKKEYTLGTSVKSSTGGDGISGIPMNLLINLLFH